MSESSAKPVLLTMQDIHIDGRSGDTWSMMLRRTKGSLPNTI